MEFYMIQLPERDKPMFMGVKRNQVTTSIRRICMCPWYVYTDNSECMEVLFLLKQNYRSQEIIVYLIVLRYYINVRP